MSTRPLSCLACGTESFDVRLTLVITPPSERREVTVDLAYERKRGEVPSFTVARVPEVYAHEPRCRDRDACAARVEAIVAGTSA